MLTGCGPNISAKLKQHINNPHKRKLQLALVRLNLSIVISQEKDLIWMCGFDLRFIEHYINVCLKVEVS